MTDFKTLRRIIHKEEDRQVVRIREESPFEILVDDFELNKFINYRLVLPHARWLAGRVVWAPSVVGDKDKWAEYIANYLLKTDPNMLICLNRIIIATEDAADIQAICNEMNAEPCEFPDICECLGCLWDDANSVIVNLAELRRRVWGVSDNAFESPASMQYRNFFVTLLCEIRRLGLSCNPYLPADEYPEGLKSESAVEDWAVQEFGSITV